MKKMNRKKNNEDKKQRLRNLRGTLLIAALTVVILAVFTLGLSFKSGAFGDYNDYDYDSGGSDWGDSDWGSSSDWDSDSSGGSGDGIGFLFIIWELLSFLPPKYRCCCIILIIIVVIVFTSVRKIANRKNVKKYVEKNQMRQQNIPKQPSQPAPRKQAPLVPLNIPNRDMEIARIISERDPNFTSPDFITFAKNVYMNIQDAWCQRDLEPVRAILHQNLYERTEKQVQKKIADGIVQHLDRLTVNDAYMTSYRKDAQFEYVKVYLNSSMIDYQVKESTGQILYGDQSTRWTMRYEMTFMRSLSAKTPEAGAKEIGMNCPNCGAPLKGASFGKCPYCDSIVTTGLYNWVLSDFNAIKDHFNDEGITI